jgi:hypothetical protein
LNKVLKGCLMAVAGISLLMALLFAAFVGWGVYANHRAESQADAFCRAVHPGEPIAEVEKRAQGTGAPGRSGKDSDEVYHYYWFGMIFTAHECRVATARGRVSSKQRFVQDD